MNKVSIKQLLQESLTNIQDSTEERVFCYVNQCQPNRTKIITSLQVKDNKIQ